MSPGASSGARCRLIRRGGDQRWSSRPARQDQATRLVARTRVDKDKVGHCHRRTTHVLPAGSAVGTLSGLRKPRTMRELSVAPPSPGARGRGRGSPACPKGAGGARSTAGRNGVCWWSGRAGGRGEAERDGGKWGRATDGRGRRARGRWTARPAVGNEGAHARETAGEAAVAAHKATDAGPGSPWGRPREDSEEDGALRPPRRWSSSMTRSTQKRCTPAREPRWGSPGSSAEDDEGSLEGQVTKMGARRGAR